MIKGNGQGKSRGMTIEDIAKKHGVDKSVIDKQIQKGIQVQRQHSQDPNRQKITAMDHQVEDPKYYTKLQKYIQKPNIKQSIKKYIKLRLIQRMVQKIPSWYQYQKLNPKATQQTYKQYVNQLQNQNWYRQMAQRKAQQYANQPKPIITGNKQQDYWNNYWWRKGQEYNMKTNKQPQMRQSVKKFQQQVARVAGQNIPMKNQINGQGLQFNTPVRNSKGQGILNKEQQKSFQKQAVEFEDHGNGLFTFDDEDLQDQLEDVNYFEDQSITKLLNKQYERQMVGQTDQREQKLYMDAIKDSQSLQDQQLQLAFEARTQQFRGPKTSNKMPIAGQEKTRKNRPQKQMNFVVPECSKSNKQQIQQGMDIQQMYDLMQSFMVESQNNKFDLTRKIVGGKNHDYDVR